MSAILEHGPRRVIRARLASAAIVVVVLGVAAAARLARAQPRFQEFSGPGLTVSIISPANGGGAPGQTLQAGVLAITNNLAVPQTVSSVMIAFSHPALFSSRDIEASHNNSSRLQPSAAGAFAREPAARQHDL
jgi:hypothetical protein